MRSFVKLLFPCYIQRRILIPHNLLNIVYEPANEMRQIIRKQLCIVDPKEYDEPGKRDVPDRSKLKRDIRSILEPKSVPAMNRVLIIAF